MGKDNEKGYHLRVYAVCTFCTAIKATLSYQRKPHSLTQRLIKEKKKDPIVNISFSLISSMVFLKKVQIVFSKSKDKLKYFTEEV